MKIRGYFRLFYLILVVDDYKDLGVILDYFFL
jgi:hypothetical protein